MVKVATITSSVGVRGIDLITGRTRWSRDDLVPVYEREPPSRGVVVATTLDADRLVVLDLHTGEERWGAPVSGEATVVGEYVWVDGPGARWARFALGTGARNELTLSDPEGRPMAESAGAAVVAVPGAIELVDPTTGAVRWRQTSQRAISVWVAGDVVLIDWGGGLSALDVRKRRLALAPQRPSERAHRRRRGAPADLPRKTQGPGRVERPGAVVDGVGHLRFAPSVGGLVVDAQS